MKLMSRSFVASLCIIVSGCTVIPLVDLYNHSGTPVRVLVGDNTHVLAAAATESFDYPTQNWGQVRVCLDGKLLRFAVPFPPDDYYHGVAFLFLRSRIRVQLDPDGRVWILKRGEDFPVRENADQPGPFPLSPEKIDNC